MVRVSKPSASARTSCLYVPRTTFTRCGFEAVRIPSTKRCAAVGFTLMSIVTSSGSTYAEAEGSGAGAVGRGRGSATTAGLSASLLLSRGERDDRDDREGDEHRAADGDREAAIGRRCLFDAQHLDDARRARGCGNRGHRRPELRVGLDLAELVGARVGRAEPRDRALRRIGTNERLVDDGAHARALVLEEGRHELGDLVGRGGEPGGLRDLRERLLEFDRRVEAIVADLRDGLRADRIERLGHVGHDGADRGERRLVGEARHHLGLGQAFPHAAAREELPQDDPGGEDVDARVDLHRGLHLLGRDVRDATLQRSRAALRCGRRRSRAEIDDLGRAVVADDHVLRRDVAMDDLERLAGLVLEGVRVPEACGEVLDDVDRDRARDPGRPAAGTRTDARKRLSFDVLEEEERAVGILTGLRGPRDVRVLQARGEPCFLREERNGVGLGVRAELQPLDHRDLRAARRTVRLGERYVRGRATAEVSNQVVTSVHR